MVLLFTCRYWRTNSSRSTLQQTGHGSGGLSSEVGLDTASRGDIVWSPRRLRGPRKGIGAPWKSVEGVEACYRASSRAQPSGGALGTDPDRPHRSRALHGAGSFGEARSRWIRDGRRKFDTSVLKKRVGASWRFEGVGKAAKCHAWSVATETDSVARTPPCRTGARTPRRRASSRRATKSDG